MPLVSYTLFGLIVVDIDFIEQINQTKRDDVSYLAINLWCTKVADWIYSPISFLLDSSSVNTIILFPRPPVTRTVCILSSRSIELWLLLEGNFVALGHKIWFIFFWNKEVIKCDRGYRSSVPHLYFWGFVIFKH